MFDHEAFRNQKNVAAFQTDLHVIVATPSQTLNFLSNWQLQIKEYQTLLVI